MMAIFWPSATFWDQTGMVLFWRAFASATFAVVILASCALGFGWLVALTTRLRYLGTISYGIYLWHLPVLLSVQRIEGIGGRSALPLILGLTIIFAIGSWHVFEKPLLTSRRTRQAAAAAA